MSSNDRYDVSDLRLLVTTAATATFYPGTASSNVASHDYNIYGWVSGTAEVGGSFGRTSTAAESLFFGHPNWIAVIHQIHILIPVAGAIVTLSTGGHSGTAAPILPALDGAATRQYDFRPGLPIKGGFLVTIGVGAAQVGVLFSVLKTSP